MIVSEGNRYKSIRTDQEIVEMFERDYESLSPEEKEAFHIILDDFRLSGKSVFYESIGRVEYVKPPVDINTFLNDEYFLGEASKSLFPAWKEIISEAFQGKYEEVILGGSLGAGKSTAGVIMLARLLYEISCLVSPHKTYDIAPTDTIVFPILAVTEAAAHEAYGRLCEIINNSKYFQENFKPKITETNGIVFPKGILVPPPGSNVLSFIGQNAFSSLIDESNFFKKIQAGPTVKDYIKDVYEAIKRRIENRFMRNGRVPGMLILISSKADPDSFTERRIRESMHDPKVFVVEKAAYEIQPKGRYSGKTFKVAIGNDVSPSRILNDGEEDPEGLHVISVPEEFRQSFERDIEKSVRETSGYATISVTPFIHNRQKILKAQDPSRRHPFSVEVWDQDIPGQINWDLICNKNKDGSWQPKLNPSAPRHIHFDMSKNKDSSCFAVGHIAGWKSVQLIGDNNNENAPCFIIDFMLKVRPPASGRDINYAEIRKIIYQFSAHGFFIKKATSDQFNSVAILEPLSHQGIKTEQLSVDRLGPYDILKTALYDERVSYYPYPPLIKELRSLEKNWKTGKVDHPQQGEKDVADTVCGVVASLTAISSSQTPFAGFAQPQMENLDDESWVLDGAIQVERTDKDKDTQDWKNQAEKQNRKNFVMPFIMG